MPACGEGIPPAPSPADAWWIETFAKIFGKSVEWATDWMNKKPSEEEARAILGQFKKIAEANGATISGLKETVVVKTRYLEAALRLLLETQKIRVTGKAAPAHGVHFLVPGQGWVVMDMTVWVEALRMLMVHPQWPGNHSKTAEQLQERLANIKNKPIYELLSGLGFSVPPNIAPHTRKRTREEEGNACTPPSSPEINISAIFAVTTSSRLNPIQGPRSRKGTAPSCTRRAGSGTTSPSSPRTRTATWSSTRMATCSCRTALLSRRSGTTCGS